jgi:trk system potassium uptake protein
VWEISEDQRICEREEKGGEIKKMHNAHLLQIHWKKDVKKSIISRYTCIKQYNSYPKLMKVLIVGGGTTGLTLANLIGEEDDVTILEQDEERAIAIANETHALVVHGDGTDTSLLQESGLNETDVCIVTADDKNNLMACQIAKNAKVKNVIALVREPKNEELFTQLGVSNIVSAVGTNVTAIKRLMRQKGEARIIAQLGEGDMQIVEMRVVKESPLVNKPAEIKNTTISAIYRDGELTLPNESTILQEGDVLLLVAKTKDLPTVINKITG